MQSFAKNRILRIRRLQRWRGIAAMQQDFDSPLNIPGLPNRRETACVVPRPSIPGATGLFFGLLRGFFYSPVWVRQDSRIFRRHLRQDHFQPSRHLLLNLKAWHPGLSLNSAVSSRAPSNRRLFSKRWITRRQAIPPTSSSWSSPCVSKNRNDRIVGSGTKTNMCAAVEAAFAQNK